MRLTKEKTNLRYVIGANLKKLRKQNQITMVELGEKLKCTSQQISKYELGINTPSAATLYLIAKHLGVPLNKFFKGLDN